MLAVVKYVTILLRTGAARLGKKCKQKATELSIGGLSMKRSQPVHGYSSVPIGCNPRSFRVLKALGTPPVEIGSLVLE